MSSSFKTKQFASLTNKHNNLIEFHKKYLILHKNWITSVPHIILKTSSLSIVDSIKIVWLPDYSIHDNKYTSLISCNTSEANSSFTRIEFPLTFKGKFLMIITWCVVHWSLTWVHRSLTFVITDLLSIYLESEVNRQAFESDIRAFHGQLHVSKVCKSLPPILIILDKVI